MEKSKVGSKVNTMHENKKNIKKKVENNNINIVNTNFFSKYGLRVAALLFIFITIIVVININKKIAIDGNSNISELNADKYSKEIVSLYNRDNELKGFLTEMDRVQSLVGAYLITNCTLKENSFTTLVENLNKEINNEKWIILDSEKSKYYNGKYSIDDNGNLKFKFDNKKIEPEWIHDESISRYIIFN